MTVRELQGRMTSREFTRWCALFCVEHTEHLQRQLEADLARKTKRKGRK